MNHTSDCPAANGTGSCDCGAESANDNTSKAAMNEMLDAEWAEYQAELRTKPFVWVRVTDADGTLLESIRVAKTDDNLPLTVLGGQVADLLERNFPTVDEG